MSKNKNHNFNKNTPHYLRPNFPHIEIGMQGVNGQPYINFEKYLDVSKFENLHLETVFGLSQVDKFEHGFLMGEIPPEFKNHYKNVYLESEIFGDIEKFDPTGFHRKNLDKLMTNQQKRRYCYFAMGGHSPWFGIVYLKRGHFLEKTTENLNTQWTAEADFFPELKFFIESLKENIFEEIGRCLFLISYPGVETIVHRDFTQADHKDHCINLYFSKGRPAFIYDEIKKEKFYLDPMCRAYFFNSRDYHGVDAETEFRYTLRVDGTFKKNMSEQLGLIDGYVCKS